MHALLHVNVDTVDLQIEQFLQVAIKIGILSMKTLLTILNLLITFSAPRYYVFLKVLSVFHAFNEQFSPIFFIFVYYNFSFLFALQCMSFMIHLQMYTNVCMYYYISFLLLLQVICYLSDQVSRKFTLLHQTIDIFFSFSSWFCLSCHMLHFFVQEFQRLYRIKSHMFCQQSCHLLLLIHSHHNYWIHI